MKITAEWLVSIGWNEVQRIKCCDSPENEYGAIVRYSYDSGEWRIINTYSTIDIPPVTSQEQLLALMAGLSVSVANDGKIIEQCMQVGDWGDVRLVIEEGGESRIESLVDDGDNRWNIAKLPPLKSAADAETLCRLLGAVPYEEDGE